MSSVDIAPIMTITKVEPARRAILAQVHSQGIAGKLLNRSTNVCLEPVAARVLKPLPRAAERAALA